jgi:hypothetical protein
VVEAKAFVLAVAEVQVASTSSGSRAEVWTMAGGSASRRCRALLRSDRFLLLVGWRQPVNLVSRAVGPHLSL